MSPHVTRSSLIVIACLAGLSVNRQKLKLDILDTSRLEGEKSEDKIYLIFYRFLDLEEIERFLKEMEALAPKQYKLEVELESIKRGRPHHFSRIDIKLTCHLSVYKLLGKNSNLRRNKT